MYAFKCINSNRRAYPQVAKYFMKSKKHMEIWQLIFCPDDTLHPNTFKHGSIIPNICKYRNIKMCGVVYPRSKLSNGWLQFVFNSNFGMLHMYYIGNLFENKL